MKISKCCNQKKFSIVEGRAFCINSECQSYLTEIETTELNHNSYYFCAFILAFLVCFPFKQSYNSTLMFSVKRPDPATEICVPELTLENVELKVKELQMICPEQVMAQVKLESGNLTSGLLKETNNMVGMRFPYRRETTAIGLYIPKKDTIIYGTQKELLKYRDVLTYAVYANWVDCIVDYKYWQDEVFDVEKRYLDFLRKNYAADTLYYKKVNKLASAARAESI